MILIGRLLSPFVRRVATTMNVYQIEYEHQPLQHTGDDVPALRAKNPLGRVPALVLGNDEVLVDSAVIIDYLDRQVGPDRALTPTAGKDRDQVLSLTALATGAAEKAIAVAYEVRFRPEERRHQPWVDRCAEQARGGFQHLNAQLTGDWLVGDDMSQADLTTAVAWQFVSIGLPKLKETIDASNLDQLVERMMQNQAYASTVPSV